ncbi:hypothetical protein SASC598J21_000210, partial [Snodgrassella alvi SCGC AB-598-J21]
DRIENKLNILLKFKEENDIDFVFTIYGHVYKNEQRSDIYLKKNTLDFISDLGGKLTISILSGGKRSMAGSNHTNTIFR